MATRTKYRRPPNRRAAADLEKRTAAKKKAAKKKAAKKKATKKKATKKKATKKKATKKKATKKKATKKKATKKKATKKKATKKRTRSRAEALKCQTVAKCREYIDEIYDDVSAVEAEVAALSGRGPELQRKREMLEENLGGLVRVLSDELSNVSALEAMLKSQQRATSACGPSKEARAQIGAMRHRLAKLNKKAARITPGPVIAPAQPAWPGRPRPNYGMVSGAGCSLAAARYGYPASDCAPMAFSPEDAGRILALARHNITSLRAFLRTVRTLDGKTAREMDGFLRREKPQSAGVSGSSSFIAGLQRQIAGL